MSSESHLKQEGTYLLVEDTIALVDVSDVALVFVETLSRKLVPLVLSVKVIQREKVE